MQQCPDAAGQRWYSRGLTGSPNQDAPWGNDFHGDINLRATIWKPSPAGLCTRVYRGFSHLQTDLPVPMWDPLVRLSGRDQIEVSKPSGVDSLPLCGTF